MANSVTTLAILLLLSTQAWAGNWPHWRGPDGDGVSAETNLPTQWSQTDNVVWKIEMPAWSGSTPVIWGDTIFLNTAEGGERVVRRRGGPQGGGRRRGPPPPQGSMASQPSRPDPQQGEEDEEEEEDPFSKELALWALDRKTGRLLWKRSLGGGNRQQQKQNMSSPSPVTDGKHVWVLTGTGILKCFDFEGNEVWSRDIQADYGDFGLNWGYASSPLLYKGKLYVQVLHGMKTDDPSYVLGIDSATGKTLWRVERPTDAIRESPDSYTTPAVLEYDGKTEIVISGGDYVTGHDPDSGAELWRAGGLNPEKRPNYRIVASPVVKDGIVYVSSRRNPFQAFKAGGRGDVTESHRLWQTPDGPDVPTPVTDGKYIYIVDDRGVMHCRDAKTGDVVWGPERVRPGTYSASAVLADGKIYVTSEEGVTTVLKAAPEFEVLAENELESYTLASIAISQGQLFIRTEDHLYCIGK